MTNHPTRPDPGRSAATSPFDPEPGPAAPADPADKSPQLDGPDEGSRPLLSRGTAPAPRKSLFRR